MHKSLDKFKPYVENKLLRQVISPCKKLVLFNYTDLCTYEKAWDEVTLNARGTVYEIATGKVVARSYEKFFNFGELTTEKQIEILKEQNFEVFEKQDGSLGILFYYDGEWRVSTRGSFTSDQAIKGKGILNKYKVDLLDKRFSYLVEIIYPENKIIVDYGDKEDLVLLGSYNLEAGVERFTGANSLCSKLTGIPLAPSSKFNSISSLQAHLETLDHTEEGYVVKLESGYRIKFKSAEYLRIARMISNMTPLAFWKSMVDGKVKVEYLEHLPEEFREEADKLTKDLEARYIAINDEICCDFNKMMKCAESVGTLEVELRKYFGIYLIENEVEHSGAMFPMLLGQSLDKYIMKELRPKANILDK